MGDNYWMSDQLKNDDGFNNPSNDDQLMSSFLNYMDDGNDNNNSTGGNGNNGGSGSGMNISMGMSGNGLGSNGQTSQSGSFDMGISPAAILNQRQNQNQNQFQQRSMQEQQNISPVPNTGNLQRPSDTNDLIQSLLSDRTGGNSSNQMFQPPQQQNQGFPPQVFSPSSQNPTIPPQMAQQQPNQPNQQSMQQMNPGMTLDKAAMIAALQQRTNQSRIQQQQMLQQQFIQQQQQQNQSQQQPGQTQSPTMGNQAAPNQQQQQQQVFQQLQQQQVMRLHQLQQQQRQRQQQQAQQQQAQQQSQMSPASSAGQDNSSSSPMVQNQFNIPFSANQRGNAPQAQEQAPPTPQAAVAESPYMAGGANANLTQEQMAQRKLQHQASAMQVELFMKTLAEFMNKRGTPLTSIPVVGGKKLHPFFLYALVARLGGSSNVARQNQWGLVAQKLGLPADQNPQLVRELTKAYVDFLFPFEQYAGTPEGQRDLHMRRQALQRQQAELIKQRQGPQPKQSPVVPTQTASQLPTPVTSQPSHLQHQPGVPPSQQPSQPPTPAQPQFQLPNRKSQSGIGSPLTHNQTVTQRHASGSHMGSSHASPMVPQQNVQSPVQQMQSSEPQASETPSAPSIVKNYIPEQRLIDHHTGYDVKSLSQVGEQIDTAKPIFLFAPELGALNIHALTMSLDSDITSEVNTALNTILVASADNNLIVPLKDCPDFLEALAGLGTRVLDQLLDGSNSRSQVGVEEVELDSLDTAPGSRVDDIFKKYVKEDEDYEEIEIKVDSLSGKPLDEGVFEDDTEEAMEVDEKDDSEESDESSVSPSDWSIPDEFHIPSYFEMLTAVRTETEHPFSSIHTRTAENKQVLLIDQLTTISMIFRNISFIEYNPNALASSDMFRDFQFKLIFAVAAHGEKFIFTRRRLGFLKDSLIILMNIAHLLELRSYNEALTILILILSFGADEPEDEHLLIPEYIPSAHKYQSHGIDVLAKLISRDPPNRAYFQGVLTGVYDPATSPDTIEQNTKLIDLYIGKEDAHSQLLTDVFRYLMSIIPLNHLTPHQLLQDRDAAILQSLLASMLITEMIPTEVTEGNLPLSWLSSSESIGNGLTRLALMLAVYSVRPNENETLKLISTRALIVVNTLISKSLAISEFQERESDLELFDKAKIRLPSDAILGTLLSSIDLVIIDHILTLSGFLKRINKSMIATTSS